MSDRISNPPAYATARRAPAASATQAVADDAAVRGSIWVVLFLLALLQPGYLDLSGTMLGGGRSYSLLAALPVMVAVLSGHAGRIAWPDIFMVAFTVWMFVSIAVVHGADGNFRLIIATMAETVVPYFLGRLLIQDAASMRFLFRCLLWAALILLPFAVIEAFSGRNVLAENYNRLPGITGFPGTTNPPRLGLERADVVFEHPILYGLFCSIPLTIAWLAAYPRSTVATRGFWSALCILSVVFSVSTGALLSVVLQAMLIGWHTILRAIKARWKLLLAFGVLGYLALLPIMDSSPFAYVAMNLSLSAGSAWNRILIWEHGTQNVLSNPIFGIGFNDWERPFWMLPSVDNFWLLIAMRHGLVGFALLGLAIGIIFWRVARRNFAARPLIADMRVAYLITLTAVFIVMITVHLWSATYMLVMFLIGAGMWFTRVPETAVAPPAETVRRSAQASGPDRARRPRHYNRDHLRDSDAGPQPKGRPLPRRRR